MIIFLFCVLLVVSVAMSWRIWQLSNRLEELTRYFKETVENLDRSMEYNHQLRDQNDKLAQTLAREQTEKRRLQRELQRIRR